MSFFDMSSQDFCESVAFFGFFVVIVGVALEVVDLIARWRKEHRNESILVKDAWWIWWVEAASIILVVLGLAVEFGASIKATLIARQKSDRLNVETKEAYDKAGVAIEQAGVATNLAAVANEKASRFDAARAEAEKETAQIRSKNLELQLKLQPRIITLEQITNFIILTKRIIPKPKIRVAIGEMRDETFNYAWQIRQMLNQAGFEPPDSDTNVTLGVNCNPNRVSWYPFIGYTNKWNDLDFNYNSTNDLTKAYNFNADITNGFMRPIIPEDAIGDTNIVYAAMLICFSEIGITNYFAGRRPEFVNPGQFEVYVMQKPQ